MDGVIREGISVKRTSGNHVINRETRSVRHAVWVMNPTIEMGRLTLPGQGLGVKW